MSKPGALTDLEKKADDAEKDMTAKTKELEDANLNSVPVRRERIYTTIESAQIRTMINVLKQRKIELAALIKDKGRVSTEIEDKTRAEIAVHKQKVKHILHTHANDLHKISEDHIVVKRQQETEFADIARRAESEASHIHDDYLNNQGSHAIQIKQHKDDAKNINMRYAEQYKRQYEEILKQQQQNLAELFEDYNLQKINELQEIQERKDHHICRLIRAHKKAFEDMRAFFNKITQNHLTSIAQYDAELTSIVARLHDYETRKKSYDKDIAELNRQLALKKEENSNLHKTLSTYESDKMALANSRAMIASLNMEIDSFKHRRDTKENRFRTMENEKDHLLEKFEFSVHDVKQKTEFRALLLEKKVETLGELLKKKEGTLEEMMETSDVPPDELDELTYQVSELLSAKNAVIENLEYELAKATKGHNDLIEIFRAKMAAAGVPEDELDLAPRPSNVSHAPAPSMFG